ncbi:RNA polymerase sigma factor (sigma-70 family) [Mycobacterium frederiksbergense]|uniref:RNA polymerase sigma factor n=1 Tax=Mycolicibacterium frederiksbergense TaxID=117567 RepID=A0ABT6KY46_9MYCO|nr:sigma-70 family RNA polymerase sigma factor [Mycolicibacterium frederiksbergense]MDH6194897.1 RNA polymerase sigma factor (sigma-70 family) [Mycolicibacterium frederiksbergense]
MTAAGPLDIVNVLGEHGHQAVAASPASEAELAAHFAAEAAPLLDALARRARRLTNCEADAEDLLQDTLLHAWQGFRSFREGTNLNAWLFRILHNRWVSRHRYRERRPTEVPLDVITDAVTHVSGTRRSVEVEVLDLMPDGDIKAALAALPDGVRTAMYYVGVEGYTYAETAAIMNVPMGTVMSRVSRGRQRLRIALSYLEQDCAEFNRAHQRSA